MSFPTAAAAEIAVPSLDTGSRSLAHVGTDSKIRVLVTEGPDAGLSRDIDSRTLHVGSAPDNDLVLTDCSVSRHHCAIEPVLAGVRIRDEGSTNGVFMGNVRLFDALFSGPVRLRLGDSSIDIEPLGDTVALGHPASDRFHGLIGRSRRMRELFADLARIAPTDLPVLIEGEPGSGKERVAEALHAASNRARGPFILFDCSSVAPHRVESELFGHEDGAFDGAGMSRPGIFEQAAGGTIFLDDLGELPKDVQPKLLRVLDRREVRRLGSQRTTPVNVRVIAATHRNLALEVRRGTFRDDLYFRTATAVVRIPPLRDRLEDLPLLVEHFLEGIYPRQCSSDIPAAIWALFEAHRWPGNVRELSNAILRFTLTPDQILPEQNTLEALRRDADPIPPLRVARRNAIEAFERAYLGEVLRRSGGNLARAAALADVSRQMIHKLAHKHAAN